MEYIINSIPFFALLIGIEYWVTRHHAQEGIYSISDTCSNIACGLLQVVTNFLFTAVMAFVYIFIYTHFAFFTLGDSILVWIFAFISVDFFYYIFHRVSHRVALFWALHVVHHQSEYFNLSVAVRQSAFGGFFSWIFYVPLAFIGIPPEMMATSLALNLLYQFWIHTPVINKCGFLESVMNTPSHHRVHHGRNPKYIDKNYAGVLIIWDKLFGTFEPENEKADFGITKPFRSRNPIWANFHVWFELVKDCIKQNGFRNKISVFFKPPG